MVFKLTLQSMRKDLALNIIISVLLSLLFFAELSLYHYLLYSETILKERYETDFSRSSYHVLLSESIDKNKLDKVLLELPDTLSSYEDVVITTEFDDSENDAILMSFYNGMSPLHNFISGDSTSEKFNEELLTNEQFVLGTNDINPNGFLTIEGNKYKLVQYISELGSYGPITYCCSSNNYFKLSSEVNELVIEYKEKLSTNELKELEEYCNSNLPVKEIVNPVTTLEDTTDTISNRTYDIVRVIIIMFVITICILPIIKYCLWKRHLEFKAYRMCGAAFDFIYYCELMQVTLLSIFAIIIGTLLSINYFKTTGFWVMYIFACIIFILRIYIEVIIDSRVSNNISEVNKKWK